MHWRKYGFYECILINQKNQCLHVHRRLLAKLCVWEIQ